VPKQALAPAEERATQVARAFNSEKRKPRYENVLIVGATSSLARAFASALAERGTRLYLAARDAAEADRVAQDLAIRTGCQTWSGLFVAEDYDSHKAFVEQVKKTMGTIDGVFVAVGQLGDQQQCQSVFENAKSVIDTNYTGVVSLLTYVSNYLETRQTGFIIAIGSVAGDRGRLSNYLYGSAKAAIATYMQGLRHRLSRSGVLVMTVKPGFLDTKMTYGLVKGPLVADVHTAARDILAALDRNELIVYVPWFWRHIMQIIRAIPERIFQKLKI
jgi:decaprenylphospho-beta-D-erythro-pentofuranosid-2-ulose 2-reductase